MPHPVYPSKEIVRRGEELYEKRIRSIVEPDNKGKYLTIDIETGDYEMGDDQLTVAERSLAKHPGAALYIKRVGYDAALRIGAGSIIGRTESAL